MAFRLGVDVGAAFTDPLLFDHADGRSRRHKTPSMLHASSDGVLSGVEEVRAKAGAVTRRGACAIMFAAPLAALLAQPSAQAQASAWPDRPLKLVVPFLAGSPADVVARVIGEAMAKGLGQPVVIDNKPGASAQIGTEAAARAAPDGLTFVLGSMDSHALNPLVYSKLRYDPVKDFVPIGLVQRQQLVLVGSTAAPFKTAAELVAAAKREPGRISFGTWGQGSVAHVWLAMLESAAGIELNHIPYPGTPVALNALLGQQLDLMFLPPLLAQAQADTGKLRLLGSTAARRQPPLPDLPTLAEQGFAGFEGSTWFALFAPAGVPPDRAARLHRELQVALRQPEVVDKLASFTMIPAPGAAEELSRTMAESRAALARAIAARQIKVLD